MPKKNSKLEKPNPTPSIELADLIAHLREDPALADQIAYVREFSPVEARMADWPAGLASKARERLESVGIVQPYAHQAEATRLALEGRDVMVTTGTNSGKTFCYSAPALDILFKEPVARILYLFPTKALAQDQLGKLEQLLPDSFRAGTYDGDTPKSQRGPLRNLGHMILTNPDMLHVGILPGHELWSKFLRSLRLIVVDEMHAYRGVFGSHVAGVLRRLLRLCEWHRSRPQIIGCSATIGNPEELFEKLTGRRPVVVDRDGSPQARRTFVFWNPPLIGEQRRAGGNLVSSEVLATLVESGRRTLCFNRARISAELVLRYTRKRLETSERAQPKLIEAYRGGYTAKERRQIETAVFKGKLMGLSATNAMELGVDIGGLDAVVMNGYPGSVSAFWQQSGRGGRGIRDGLAVLVAHEDPLDQFLIRNPALLMDGLHESVNIHPQNPQILASQLRCAAHERPIGVTELDAFGGTALEVAEGLDRSGELSFRNGMFYYPSFDSPAAQVNIRGSSGDTVELILEGEELGTMDRWRAMQQAHEGAVYLHRGVSYLVQNLDLDSGKAIVAQENVPYFTRSMLQSVLETRLVLESADIGAFELCICSLKVTDSILGYQKVSLDGERVLDICPLDLPPLTYDTVGLRLDLPEIEESETSVFGVHGAEHALLAVAPLLAGCDRNDLGSAWYALYPDTFRPAVFVFDRTPGGIGLTESLYLNRRQWIEAAADLLTGCPCTEGCPSCLLSSSCESGNEHLSKQEAIRILLALRKSL